jgi:hypothetical protein
VSSAAASSVSSRLPARTAAISGASFSRSMRSLAAPATRRMNAVRTPISPSA